MKSALSASVRSLILLTLLTGVVYPVAITGFAQFFFPDKASGSLVKKNGQILGSRLLAQKVTDPSYFWYRPSASNYATVPSGASNFSPASQNFVNAIRERQKLMGEAAPADLLTTSGSGLDPDISIQGAVFQLGRIAKARGMGTAGLAKLQQLVDQTAAKGRSIWGPSSLNVMDLNRVLDEFVGSR
jgi:K+-transporting ATPase ATPase C chain